MSEQEVTQTIIDEEGQEQTVTVKVQKPKRKKSASEEKEKSEKKLERKKSKGGKESSKHGEKDKKSKHDSIEESKEDKKSRKKEKEKSGYSDYGDSAYTKVDKKKRDKKLSLDNLGETAEIINLSRRVEAAENGIKSLRNIIDSMVNQVDFGDEVGGALKAQLEQVQQQMNKVELVPQEPTGKKEKKKRKESKSKTTDEVPKEGIITESSAAPQSENVVPVIPPPSSVQKSQDMPKLQPGRTPSRGRKISVPLKGEQGARPPSQGDKPPMRKRTTLRDLQLRKKAREEGVSVEELEAQEAEEEETKGKPQKAKEKKKKEEKKDKDDQDKKSDDESSSDEEESLDSGEEDAAMDEMIMEEIAAALENSDDPEAQLYALRLGIEQMTNMKRSFGQAQDEFRKEMDKNRRAIEQISKDLAAFRTARKAQVRFITRVPFLNLLLVDIIWVQFSLWVTPAQSLNISCQYVSHSRDFPLGIFLQEITRRGHAARPILCAMNYFYTNLNVMFYSLCIHLVPYNIIPIQRMGDKGYNLKIFIKQTRNHPKSIFEKCQGEMRVRNRTFAHLRVRS